MAVIPCAASNAQKATRDTIKVNGQPKNNLTATGIIKDAATGKPIAAATVSIPDYSAALTDDNGKFVIRVPDYDATLFVTSQGSQSKEIPLKGRNSVSASLYEETFNSIYDNAQLPFGPKSRNQLVNAAVSLNTRSSWNRPTETIESFLEGKAAGLQSAMRSGTPNAGAYLILRGYNSLYTNNQPLVVVDGMIYDINDYGGSLISNHYTNALSNIDIRDIENITIIKDGVSTYGSKAANGVLLITTTHATNLATKIDFEISGGTNFVPRKLPVLNAADFRTYLSDILKTRGWSDAQIQAQPYMNDDTGNPYYYRYHNNTDWQSLVSKNSAVNNYYLKVTGGDNIARYALSMGYTKNAGITQRTDLTRYNVRFNSDLSLSRKLTAGTSLAYTYYEQNLKDQGIAPKTNPVHLALIKAPFLNKNEVDDKGAVSPNLADTDTFGVSNPAAIIENAIANSKVYRFFGSVNLKYRLSNNISLATIGGITLDQVREQTFIPKKGVANDTLSNAIADSRLGGQAKKIYALYNDTYINYIRTFRRIHRLDARAGFRFMATSTSRNYQLGYNSATDDFISVGTGVNALRKVGGDAGKAAWTNTYIGADYSLSNKYFLSLNLAVDGSSRFGSQLPKGLNISGADVTLRLPYGMNMGGHNFAIMPSIGASWLISSENELSDLKFLDLLKLRVSFSRTGNDDIGNYTAKQSYVSQNLLGMQGLVRGNIANPALTWEINKKSNLGLDAAFFNERLNLSIDVYRNITENMLTYETPPIASGFDFAVSNEGALKTTGIDISASARIINTNSVKWDLGLSIASYKNTIMQLPGNSVITSFGGAAVLTQVGSPAGMYYGFKTNGVYATDAEAAASGLYKKLSNGTVAPFKEGDVRFINIKGTDSLIDDNDRQVIGNPNPDFTGGFSNRITWKGLTMEALFTFSYGNKLYNGVRAALEAQSGSNNQLASVVSRWRVPGQVTNVPKPAWGDPMGNSSFSDRWIEDGSFLRMKTVSLSYDLPLPTGKSIKSVTVYVTGNNLLTFTRYLGYDPGFFAAESILARGIDVGLEPQFKSFIAGIRVGL
jgi:TonB-dependent SusC/RagA subfamily outer membrane receptor